MGSRHILAGVALAVLGACGEKFTTADPGRVPDAGPDARGGRGGQGGTGGQGGSTADAADAPPDVPVGPAVPLDGLVLWLRADRGVTLEGDGVVSWSDQSGEGNDAIQPAPDQRPRLVEAAMGGGPSVDFDGIDDYLSLPSGFSDFRGGVSIFAVALQRATDSCVSLLHLSNGSEAADISLGTSDGDVLYEVENQYEHGSELPVDVPLVWAVVHRPDTSFEVRLNRQPALEGSYMLPEVVDRALNSVGNTLYENCRVFPGQVAELLVYARGLREAELTAVEDYLGRRVGL